MKTSSRVATVLGLAVVGVASLASRSTGQESAQKAANQPAQTLPPAVIGCIDMDAVFKGYEKVEFIRKSIEAEANIKKAELTKIMGKAQQVAKEMEKLTPGSPDFKNHDAKLARLKADLDSARELAQRDFAMREAEALATVYKEIQAMVEAVAKHNHMNYVVRISNEPVSAGDPNATLAAMSRSVVFSDPAGDITQIVIKLLNREYQKTNPPKPPTTSTPAEPAPAPAAAANTRAADSQIQPTSTAKPRQR
jgi:outer membrane protein